MSISVFRIFYQTLFTLPHVSTCKRIWCFSFSMVFVLLCFCVVIPLPRYLAALRFINFNPLPMYPTSLHSLHTLLPETPPPPSPPPPTPPLPSPPTPTCPTST